MPTAIMSTTTAMPIVTAPTYSHGALLLAEDKTQFSLWAPDANKVTVKLADNRSFDLHKEADGWHRTLVACGAGTAYRFIINGKLRVPDPAARRQLGDVHGLSCVLDPTYPWKMNDWQGRPWHEAVVYELHVGIMGGFRNIEQYLPELVALGVTAVELMPISEFPGTRNWGYDGVLPFAPESAYGTPDELKSLIDTAHSLGLMVLLDVVYNHFGPDGNYLGAYAKRFFRTDIHTPWGAAIDFRQPAVRDFFCENALMWLMEYRFDGLRLDAVHAISEKDFLVELAERVRRATPAGRHIHLILENEENSARLLQQGFDAQWNDDGHNVLHHLLTQETEGYYADYAQSPTEKLARCLAEGFVYQGELTRTGQARGEPSGHLAPSQFVLFLQNHDQIGNRAFGERLTQLIEPSALQAATVLLLLSPMVPLLFMGDEWGTQQPFLYFTDHEDELAKAVRDGRRNEFAQFAKFNDPELRQHIPDPNAINTFLSSKFDIPEQGPAANNLWWKLYQTLLALRHREIIPRLPGTTSAGVTILGDAALCAAWALGDGCQLHIYLNFSHTAVAAHPRWPVDTDKPVDTDNRVLFKHRVNTQDYQQGILPAQSALVTLLG